MNIGDISNLGLLSRIEEEIRDIEDPENVKEVIRKHIKYAENFVDPKEQPGRFSTRGRTYFDDVVFEILELTRSAVSREKLLEIVLNRLQEAGGGIQGKSIRPQATYILLTGRVASDRKTLADIKIEKQVGVQLARFSNYTREVGDKLLKSKVLHSLFVDRSNVEFIHSEYLRGNHYFGEFDGLVDSTDRGVWIVGIPLPSIDKRKPDRAIIGLYPSVGSKTRPRLPRGGKQEWRVLEFTQVAYSLLNHQLGSIAEQLAAERRKLVSDLAPGIVNHEIGILMGQNQEIVESLYSEIKTLFESTGYYPMYDRIAKSLANIFDTSLRTVEITDAFNNLERRQALTKISASDLIEQIVTITRYRAKKRSIRVESFLPFGDFDLNTDSALLTHALLNIIINAIDALMNFDEERKIGIQAKKIEDGLVEFIIANNGPPISSSAVFEKGVTTKGLGVGHGQGLFICRLVAEYLGGSVDIIPDNELSEGMHVAFKFIVPQNSERSDDIYANRKKKVN